jgi:branched-chain amino acid transport system substrate-binding protein
MNLFPALPTPRPLFQPQFAPPLLAPLVVLLALSSPCLSPAQTPAKPVDKPVTKGLPDIAVGAISSLSGPVAFPESSDAVRAYFNVVNANGGIQGRALRLTVEDDRGTPEAAHAAAAKLLQTHNVVAMVGSASIVDCASNATTYEKSAVVAIQGTGVEAGCFTASNIAPVNTGPYLSAYTALDFAVAQLHSKRPCVMVLNLGAVPTFERVLAQWAKNAKQPAPVAIVFSPGDDQAPLLARVQQEKCDAVVHSGVEPMVLDWVAKSRKIDGFASMPQIFLTPAYTQKVAQVLAGGNDNIYAMSEFEPWSSRSGSLSDWSYTMTKAKVPLSSFSQGGYSAAQVFVRVLRSIKGPITRESVTEAFKTMAPIDVPMLGTPYIFGKATQHNPNHATLPLKLVDGKWRIAHYTWVVVPE